MINVDIFPDEVIGEINPMIYGQMIEHAYWSVHMGLWAQMLDNGGFELDRDGKYGTVAQGWNITSTSPDNKVQSSVDGENPYNARYSQKIVIHEYNGGEIRLYQNGLYVKAGEDYSGAIYVKGRMTGNLCISLNSLTKEQIDVKEFGQIDHDDWQRYDFTLHSAKECKNAAFYINFSGKGTIWIDQAQLTPANTYKGHGTRPDVVELFKNLKPPYIRWPGGTYLIWHHWKNGIGPQEDRLYGDGRILAHMGIAHEGEWDPNAFGTDEFIQLCRDINAEPMLNFNIKDGLENALDWVEYCNGDSSTKWGSLRAKYGHPEPYNVKYWVIDNEPLNRNDQKRFDPNMYPHLARLWAEAIKKKDSSIKILVMGDHKMGQYLDNVIPQFNCDVIEETKEVMDHFCIHCYYDQTFYAPLQGMPYKIADAIGRLKKKIDEVCTGRDVKVAFTEWNPQSSTDSAGNMGQALEAALIFNMMERKSAEGAIDVATPCQLCINTDKYRGLWLRSAPIQINNHTSWVSPMYLVNMLYSSLFAPSMIKVKESGMPFIDSQAFSHFMFPALDIVASKNSTDGRIIIKVVNNDCNHQHNMTLKIHGNIKNWNVKRYDVSSDNIEAVNTVYKPNEVSVNENCCEIIDSELLLSFAPASVTILDLVN